MFAKAISFPGEVDEEQLRQALERPAPKIRYCVLFTPRSGSSWLTDVARQTGRLSHPGEHFNPNFVPKIAANLNARTLEEYVEVLIRRRSRRGVYGFEITYFQLKGVFGSRRAFMRAFGEAAFFWLIREDVILQAISLMKMQQTRISHHKEAPDEERAQAEKRFVYDEAQIRRWIRHLRQIERKTESMIAAYGVQVHRMSYERNMAQGALGVVREMAGVLGIGDIPPMAFEEGHQKLATPANAEMADRFRAANGRLVARLHTARAPMLAALSAPALTA